MPTDWASTISYNDFVTAVQNSYGGSSSISWTQISQAMANAGCTTDNYLNYLEAYPNAVDIVKNADGSIRAVRANPYASIYSDSTWNVATSAGTFNSNLMPPSASSATTTTVTVPGTPVIDSATKKLTFKQGMSQAGNFVMKEVAPAVVAAGCGIKLGKFIDGAIYDIGTALGLDPPWSLNPNTWDSITAGDDSMSSRLFNMVFGIDDSGNTQAYVDENAFAYMAQWLNTQNFFGGDISVEKPPNMSFPFESLMLSARVAFNSYVSYDISTPGPRMTWIGESEEISTPTEYIYLASDFPFDVYYKRDTWRTESAKQVSYNNKQFYVFQTSTWRYNNKITIIAGNRNIYNGYWFQNKEQVGYFLLYGKGNSGAPDGVSNQTGSTLPNTSDWTDPAATLASLKEQYPELFENAITQDVVQPDGSVHTYTYIPTGFPMPDGSTGTQTQNDTQVNPETSPKELVDYILSILVPPVTPNPPDTGDGNTPPVVIPTGSASSLWSIYNPTQEQLDAFGAWLWSSDLVDQIKKLFSNPMESIIGVHKVFAPPAIAGTATIKCGYIDSGVPSNYIKNQYVSIDCGSVLLTEYFGNVFDYDPYTKVSLFLPFIGIVPLNVADIMRGKISVKYNVDVITGACLAEVQVIRDGVGGIIYTFSGSAIVSYPLSSGSYAGIIGGILGIAGGVIGSIASGGALAPLALGAASSVSHLHTTVQKSGSFSGAPGAMGGKIPYLIITRPQTCLADNYPLYDGVGANHTTQLSACTGYTKVKEVHLKVPNAYESELKEIESMLLSGILI